MHPQADGVFEHHELAAGAVIRIVEPGNAIDQFGDKCAKGILIDSPSKPSAELCRLDKQRMAQLRQAGHVMRTSRLYTVEWHRRLKTQFCKQLFLIPWEEIECLDARVACSTT